MTTKRLIPVAEWERHHPWPTCKALRGYMSFAESNGASVWIVRLGRRVLVDEAAFFEWARTAGDRALRKSTSTAA